MPNDILNTSGGTTGNQVQGLVRVAYPASFVGDDMTYAPVDVTRTPVADIADKYDSLYDEVNYY